MNPIDTLLGYFWTVIDLLVFGGLVILACRAWWFHRQEQIEERNVAIIGLAVVAFAWCMANATIPHPHRTPPESTFQAD